MTLSEPLRGINDIAYQKMHEHHPTFSPPTPTPNEGQRVLFISTTKTQEKNGVLYKKSSPKARNTNK